MSNADLESITHLQIRMPAAICGAFYAPTLAAGWQHALTLPREITWSDGRLLQNPLPEFVDNSMVEIYINDGEYVMTSRFYFPEKNARNFNIHRLFVLKKVGGCYMSALL